MAAKMFAKKLYIIKKIATKVLFLLHHLDKLRRYLQIIKDSSQIKAKAFAHLPLSKPLRANSAGSRKPVHTAQSSWGKKTEM